VLLVLLLPALAAAGCREGNGPVVVSRPPVAVAPVEARTVVDRILVTGEIIAVNEASVSAEVDGRVTSILLCEGEAVEKGETVFEIDRERRQLELANALAGLEEAIARFDQQQVGLAERALRHASVAAPFSGIIARRHVSEGEFVKPGGELFDLVSLDPIEVEFRVPERDAGRIEKGQTLEVRVAPFPGEVYHATINMISPRIDRSSRTLRIKAMIENRDGRLRPGLFARADLGLSERSAVPMVPESAILQRADGSVVFRLVAGDRVERVALTTGVFSNGQVEVVDGVDVSDVVVVRGHARLMDGSVVDVRTRAGKPVANSRPSDGRGGV